MSNTGNIQSLADQVERLEKMNKEIEETEESLKEKKKQKDHVSMEVIPTLMSVEFVQDCHHCKTYKLYF